MNYDNPELMRQLGAEYALGTLRGPARRRFERLFHTHSEARAQVDFWEQRLSEFGQIVIPVAPPVTARSELLRRTEPPVLTAPPRRRKGVTSRRRRTRWTWPYVAGFATAASLGLAFLLGQRSAVAPLSAPSSPLAATEQSGEELPTYVAQLGMPASGMRWLISASSGHRRLTVVASDDFLQVGRHSVQLWGVVPGTAPVALGVLPTVRDASASFEIPASLRRQPVRFLVSLEPAGGSSDDGPRGPVMNEASALGEI
ncbi:MAG: anti-sigma factor [Panacagrimonas sp.]